MSVSVLIRDEMLGGANAEPFVLEFPSERMSIRELIRERVYQEVEDHNRGGPEQHPSRMKLVEPTKQQAELNGEKERRPRQIDWKAQFEKACEAYEKGRIIVLVADKQTRSLDEMVELTRGVEVTFLRLVLLVGG